MNNKQLEDIRRKLQSRIKRMANDIAEAEQTNAIQDDYYFDTSEYSKERIENKRLMAALIHLQRENRELNEECNLFAASVVRRFMGENNL